MLVIFHEHRFPRESILHVHSFGIFNPLQTFLPLFLFLFLRLPFLRTLRVSTINAMTVVTALRNGIVGVVMLCLNQSVSPHQPDDRSSRTRLANRTALSHISLDPEMFLAWPGAALLFSPSSRCLFNSALVFRETGRAACRYSASSKA